VEEPNIELDKRVELMPKISFGDTLKRR